MRIFSKNTSMRNQIKAILNKEYPPTYFEYINDVDEVLQDKKSPILVDCDSDDFSELNIFANDFKHVICLSKEGSSIESLAKAKGFYYIERPFGLDALKAFSEIYKKIMKDYQNHNLDFLDDLEIPEIIISDEESKKSKPTLSKEFLEIFRQREVDETKATAKKLAECIVDDFEELEIPDIEIPDIEIPDLPEDEPVTEEKSQKRFLDYFEDEVVGVNKDGSIIHIKTEQEIINESLILNIQNIEENTIKPLRNEIIELQNQIVKLKEQLNEANEYKALYEKLLSDIRSIQTVNTNTVVKNKEHSRPVVDEGVREMALEVEEWDDDF